jgi:catechol 2,3-dioxygenase-like lactoylglutathione lyase family enzyme
MIINLLVEEAKEIELFTETEGETPMSRVQLALNVSDVDAAVEFYSKLFGTEPAKRRPGYANFAVAHPPLKLVLIENSDAAGTLNHLGVEVESTDEVESAADRFQQLGMVSELENKVTCCYALQDKVWVKDPDGAPWEIYTVLADAPIAARSLNADQNPSEIGSASLTQPVSDTAAGKCITPGKCACSVA